MTSDAGNGRRFKTALPNDFRGDILLLLIVSGDCEMPPSPLSNTRPTHELVVYHSAYGLRPSVVDFADTLRAAGHIVHTPDLYDGEVFGDREEVIRKIQDLGFDRLLERAASAVAHLPPGLVYAGFSNGGVCAELLAATRPGARAAILIHAPLLVRDLGWRVWPAGVSVQAHFANKDPIRNQSVIDSLAAKVRQSGATFELYDYDAPGHLFADPAFPAYSKQATDLMTKRVLEFLEQIATD
jgi:dienelactone hydrolase